MEALLRIAVGGQSWKDEKRTTQLADAIVEGLGRTRSTQLPMSAPIEKPNTIASVIGMAMLSITRPMPP